MAYKADRGALSLEQIENDTWGGPPLDGSYVVRTAHELHRKPIAALTTEDLRLLIGQRIGVDVLLPFALALLAKDPLIEGDFYPGDLLVAVMRQPPEYWAAHPGHTAAIRKIAQAVRDTDSYVQGKIVRFLEMTEQHA